MEGGKEKRGGVERKVGTKGEREERRRVDRNKRGERVRGGGNKEG